MGLMEYPINPAWKSEFERLTFLKLEHWVLVFKFISFHKLHLVRI
jgi:hypothetical protein